MQSTGAWPVAGSDFALATVVGCDARGLYTVFYEDDTVEDGVDEMRIRYQGQVQSDVLAPGEKVYVTSGSSLCDGSGLVSGVVVVASSADPSPTVMATSTTTSSDLQRRVTLTQTKMTSSNLQLQTSYTVQYADYVTKDGLSRETLPRSSLLSMHYWPQKATVTVQDLNDAVPSGSVTFASTFQAQHGLIQSRLNEASNQEGGYAPQNRLARGARTDPGRGARKIVARKLGEAGGAAGGGGEGGGGATMMKPKPPSNTNTTSV